MFISNKNNFFVVFVLLYFFFYVFMLSVIYGKYHGTARKEGKKSVIWEPACLSVYLATTTRLLTQQAPTG